MVFDTPGRINERRLREAERARIRPRISAAKSEASWRSAARPRRGRASADASDAPRRGKDQRLTVGARRIAAPALAS